MYYIGYDNPGRVELANGNVVQGLPFNSRMNFYGPDPILSEKITFTLEPQPQIDGQYLSGGKIVIPAGTELPYPTGNGDYLLIIGVLASTTPTTTIGDVQIGGYPIVVTGDVTHDLPAEGSPGEIIQGIINASGGNQLLSVFLEGIEQLTNPQVTQFPISFTMPEEEANIDCALQETCKYAETGEVIYIFSDGTQASETVQLSQCGDLKTCYAVGEGTLLKSEIKYIGLKGIGGILPDGDWIIQALDQIVPDPLQLSQCLYNQSLPWVEIFRVNSEGKSGFFKEIPGGFSVNPVNQFQWWKFSVYSPEGSKPENCNSADSLVVQPGDGGIPEQITELWEDFKENILDPLLEGAETPSEDVVTWPGVNPGEPIPEPALDPACVDPCESNKVLMAQWIGRILSQMSEEIVGNLFYLNSNVGEIVKEISKVKKEIKELKGVLEEKDSYPVFLIEGSELMNIFRTGDS